MSTDSTQPSTPPVPDAGAEKVADPAVGTARAAGSELIRLEKVTKRFGNNTVLDNLDFSVDAGKHVTLIGPSGSGKTTILRLLMTLLKPEEGTITVDGEQLFPAPEKQVREIRKKIGMVFQHFNLFPNMTVLRNITEAPVTVLGMSKDEAEERARELLEMVGLTEHIDKHPAQLSGGQQQRVAIARALATAPDLVFADEPTGNLDSKTGREVLRLLATASREHGQSIAMVTHDAIAASHADRVLYLGDGRIVADHPRQTAEEISAYMLAAEVAA